MPRAAIVFNPVAGRHPARRRSQRNELCQALERRSWTFADDHPDVLLVCGGDGTLHRVLQEHMRLDPGARPVLALAPPLGTANVLAHALGVPQRPDTAAAWLDRAWAAGPRQLPVGVAEFASERHYFLSMAGVGYDAFVVQTVAENAKRRWGKWAIAARAAQAWRSYFPAPLELDCTPFRVDGLIFTLTSFYAGRMRLGDMPAEGPLVLALSGAPRLLVTQALSLLTRGLDRAPGVVRCPCRVVSVATAGRPVQLDGEPVCDTPVRLSLHPDAIPFLAPSLTPNP
ncbi:MAG TPA: diacylglycerol kinase family protein [Terriglobales bacterium]|nr:diacylglycerol kinase family protein [Terriglobales bacterium]